MKKAVSIIGSTGIPARYGGFETLAEQLAINLKNKFDITVYCSTNKYTKKERQKQWNGIQRYFVFFNGNGVQSILYDLISLFNAFRKSDIILVLGGSAGLFFPFFTLLYKKKKLIFHPDGKEWSRKKWKTFSSIYLHKSILTGCKVATRIIIDNKALLPMYNDFEERLFHCSYGGDQYSLNTNKNKQNDMWLSIARAEPENSLLSIAQAFTNMPNKHWYLVSNFNTTSFGKKLYNQFNQFRNIHFIKSTFSNSDIEAYYEKCTGYIHGHTAGGTNPSLVAAMFLNKPVLCSNNKFNRETTGGHAFFFSNEKELTELIYNNNFPTEISADALKLAKKEYTWNKIAHKYQVLFEE